MKTAIASMFLLLLFSTNAKAYLDCSAPQTTYKQNMSSIQNLIDTSIQNIVMLKIDLRGFETQLNIITRGENGLDPVTGNYSSGVIHGVNLVTVQNAINKAESDILFYSNQIIELTEALTDNEICLRKAEE